jgi:hypothetical protein
MWAEKELSEEVWIMGTQKRNNWTRKSVQSVRRSVQSNAILVGVWCILVIRLTGATISIVISRAGTIIVRKNAKWIIRVEIILK